jgi:AcrR family transcriptional regulator
MAATIDCLVERGWAGTTTTEVAERAGVSRGAQLHHFPTRVALVTSAVRHLAEQWLAEFRSLESTLSGAEDRVSAVTDLLWRTFSGPLFVAAIELWVAARTDRELFATLAATERQTGLAIRDVFREVFGGRASGPDFPALSRLSIHVMRGMALESLLGADDRRRAEALELWKRIGREVLDTGPRRPAAARRRR